jgi:hypothetical protein
VVGKSTDAVVFFRRATGTELGVELEAGVAAGRSSASGGGRRSSRE